MGVAPGCELLHRGVPKRFLETLCFLCLGLAGSREELGPDTGNEALHYPSADLGGLATPHPQGGAGGWCDLRVRCHHSRFRPETFEGPGFGRRVTARPRDHYSLVRPETFKG